MTRKTLLCAFLLLILLAAGALCLREAASPVLSVTQLASTSARPLAGGKDRRLSGVTMYGTVENDSGLTRFVITDCRNDMPVEYQGDLPRDFREGRTVILTGTLESDNIFRARKLRPHRGENCDPAALAPSPKPVE